MKRNPNKFYFSDILKDVLNSPGSAFFYTPPKYKQENCYLFKNPIKSLSGFNKEELLRTLENLDNIENEIACGYLTYEAGYLLEPRLSKLLNKTDLALIKFNFYKKEEVKKFPSKKIVHDFLCTDYKIENLSFNKNEKEYINSINKIKSYIARGDTYQVNFTIEAKFKLNGEVSSLFETLLFNQSARYIALINDDSNIIISISPELFFKVNEKKLISFPMKGTIGRGKDIPEDQIKYQKLNTSIKDKAENVMIVDLIRNDLGKISKFGKVEVNSLFEIEKYETVYQMISVIKTKLKNEVKFSDIIKNIFPCGSITGAPKIRTMEIIHELEKYTRGIYTGAIGIVEKDKCIFNVPIRTLSISKKDYSGTFGIGSGVVWDSKPEEEYKETILKSNFLIKPESYFEIFTTILVENNKPFLIEKHLRRLKKTADYFVFMFDEKNVQRKINTICKKLQPNSKYRLKIIIDKWGNMKKELSELTPFKDKIKIILSEEHSPSNKFVLFKTTNRTFYDSTYRKAWLKGYEEVIFFNDDGYLTEGSRSNIFIKKGNTWYTPPVSEGLLPGVYREYFIENNTCEEKKLDLKDLKGADEVILVNALKKVLKVEEITY